MTSMPKPIRLIFGTIAVVLTACGAAAAEGGRLKVTGDARAVAVPDMARVSIGVSEEAPTAAEAVTRMSGAGTAILAGLEAAGVARADIQTGSLILRPVQDYRPGRSAATVTGFVAQTRYTIRVRRIEALGAVLDGAVQDGGANMIDSVEFALSDPGPLQDAARRDAVRDGRAKAELFAAAAGVALGPLIRLDEVPAGRGPVPVMDMRSADAGSVPVAGGEIAVEAQVTMVFAIAQ